MEFPIFQVSPCLAARPRSQLHSSFGCVALDPPILFAENLFLNAAMEPESSLFQFVSCHGGRPGSCSTRTLEITLGDPKRVLPLDLHAFVYSPRTCVLQPLLWFDDLASRLVEMLAGNCTSSEVIGLLGDMLGEVRALRKLMPPELQGSYHSLEEWEEDLVVALRDVRKIMKTRKTGKEAGSGLKEMVKCVRLLRPL